MGISAVCVCFDVTEINGRCIWWNGLQLFPTISSEVNGDDKVPFDLWFIVHVCAGMVYYSFGRIFRIPKQYLLYFVVILSTAFELFENTEYMVNSIKKDQPYYDGDSWINIITDILGTLIGFSIACRSKHPIKLTFIFNILSEIMLFLVYRRGICLFSVCKLFGFNHL